MQVYSRISVEKRAMTHPGTLTAENVSYAYENALVLNGVNLHLEPGRFTGIIGPNGSGKSTLLRCLGRLLPPLSGQVLIGKRPIQSYPLREFAKFLSLVPQEIQVDFDFSVYEVVAMGRAPYLSRLGGERPRDLAVIRDVMVKTRIWELRHRPVTDLSGGERQRVFIAQALAQEPRILLLDEPTSHLDVNYQAETFDLLTELVTEAHITVGVVLHDLNLASQYCDHLYLLHGGRVYAEGPPGEVLTRRNLQDVYGVELQIMPHPTTGRPLLAITPGQGATRRPGQGPNKE